MTSPPEGIPPYAVAASDQAVAILANARDLATTTANLVALYRQYADTHGPDLALSFAAATAASIAHEHLEFIAEFEHNLAMPKRGRKRPDPPRGTRL